MKMNIPVSLFGLVILSLVGTRLGFSYGAEGTNQEPCKFFRDYAGLNEGQIKSIRQGKAFAKVMDSPDADEVFIFGACAESCSGQEPVVAGASARFDETEVGKPGGRKLGFRG